MFKKMCYNHCSFSSPKHHRCGEWHRCYESVKDGAEFGYNKANEWHNIKENPTDLPNDEELVVADNGLAIDCVKFIKNEFGNSWKHDKFELYNVICWKKLVLSKDRNK